VKLAELQARFQDAIIGDDRSILDAVNASRKFDRAARFSVYAEAYRLRLAKFLAEDFPVLRNAIGDEMFGALVEAYIGATLSRHPNARWYARQLPEFMQRADPWCDHAEWIDLAAFERALTDAFDARDAEPREIGALASLPAEAWPNLRFGLQKSLVLLTLSRGTLAAYEVAAADEPPPPRTGAAGKETETVLVWRDRGLKVLYRKLDEAETLALTEARAGKTFGEICSLLAFLDESDSVAARAASFLSRWFADGLIVDVA
jgi:hypothetical protein